LKSNVNILCSLASVSRSGYYKYLKKAHLKERDCEDYLLIKEVFEKGKGKWGHRTIQMNLEKHMNLKKIIRIMNKYQLFTKIRKKNPYKMIMKKTAEHKIFPNILNRNFDQKIPYTCFGTDITYLYHNFRPAYLSVIKDFCTGEIVAHKLSRHIDMQIVIDTLTNLNTNLPNLKNFLIHSDQGSHYTSPIFVDAMKQVEAIQSMSRKGKCIDNAPTESFFGHLKDEVDYKHCKTFEVLEKLIAEYILYYNTKRKQWNKKKMTPVQYRDHILS
jgi:putative transposase